MSRVTTETCENCGRTIGKLETPMLHGGHVVCVQCLTVLRKPVSVEDIAREVKLDYDSPGAVRARMRGSGSAGPASLPATEYRALGLNSRGVAWGIAIVGLLLTPALIGLPMLVWGAVADHMLAKHAKSLRKHPYQRPESLTYKDH